MMDVELVESRRLASYLSLTIAALGVIGNALCAGMVMMKPTKQYSTASLILGCVVSDTVAIVIEILDNISTFTTELDATDILYGSSMWRCRFGYFFRETSRLISAWMVVAMSVELFWAKRGHKQLLGVYNRRRGCYVTLAVYLVSFAVCFPLLVIGQVSADRTCTSKYPVFYHFYTTLIFPVIVDYIVPLIFIVYCASSCLRTTDFTHPFFIKHQKQEHLQLSAFITVTSLVFVVVCLPYYILQLLLVIEQHQMSSLPKSIRYSTSSKVRLAHEVANTIMLIHYSCKFYLAYSLEEDCRRSCHKMWNCGLVKSVDNIHRKSRQAAYLETIGWQDSRF